jgi:hypothetical protein
MSTLDTVSTIVTIIVVAWCVSLVVRVVGTAALSRAKRLDANVRLLVVRAMAWSVWVLAALAVCTVLGIGVQGALTAGGAILVLGLSVQNYITNMIDGSVLLSERNYEIGDRVTMPTMAGIGGIATDLEVRYTTFSNPDGTRTIVPNTVLFNTPYVVTPAALLTKEEACSPVADTASSLSLPFSLSSLSWRSWLDRLLRGHPTQPSSAPVQPQYPVQAPISSPQSIAVDPLDMGDPDLDYHPY